MDRILCLDVGLRRVGVAVSDPLGLTAQPVSTLQRKPHGLFLERLSSLVRELGASKVVLGLPRRTTGELGPEAQRVLALAHEIRTRLGIETDTFDERLTTVVADRQLTEAGLGGEAKRRVIDMAAAAVILTGYLDHLNHRGGGGPEPPEAPAGEA